MSRRGPWNRDILRNGNGDQNQKLPPQLPPRGRAAGQDGPRGVDLTVGKVRYPTPRILIAAQKCLTVACVACL